MGRGYRPGDGCRLALCVGGLGILTVTGLLDKFREITFPDMLGISLIAVFGGGILFGGFIFKYMISSVGSGRAEDLDRKIIWVSILLLLALAGHLMQRYN